MDRFVRTWARRVQGGWLPPEQRLARRRTLGGWNASPAVWFDWLRMQTTVADLSHLSDSSPGYWKEFGYIARVCATGGRSRAESFVAWLVECADDASSAALLIALLLLRSMTAPDDPRLEVLAEELAVDGGDGDRVLAFIECLSSNGEQAVPPWSDVFLRRLSSPAVSPGVARLLEKLVTAWPKASPACP